MCEVERVACENLRRCPLIGRLLLRRGAFPAFHCESLDQGSQNLSRSYHGALTPPVEAVPVTPQVESYAPGVAPFKESAGSAT